MKLQSLLPSLAFTFIVGGICSGPLMAQHPFVEQYETYRALVDHLPDGKGNPARPGWQDQVKDQQTRGVPDFYDDTVYRTIELTFTNPDWHQTLIDNWTINDQTGEDIYVKADLKVDDVVYPEVGVQYKGNSSFWFVDGLKKPYKITMDAFIEDQEIYGYDKITLNNGVFDPTMVREVICYKILGQFMPAPRANLVRVRSGLAGNLSDIGVYASVERINKRFLRKHLNNDSGHRYKAQRGSLNWLGSDIGPYEDRYDISGGDEATRYLDLINAIDKLNNTPLASLREELDPVFSIDRAIRQITAGFALLNWDDLRAFAPNGHNYYTYQNDRFNQMIILPWDWDLGLSGTATDTINPQINNPDVPLVNQLMSIPELRERYFAFLKMMNDQLVWSEISQWVTRYRNQVESDILNGQNELFSQQEYFASHQTLETLITNRNPFVNNQADISKPRPSISNTGHTPAKPDQNNQVTVNATVTGSAPVGSVNLYYQVDGSYTSLPMADDGQNGDGNAGDGVFGAFIPPQTAGKTVNYYIEAATDSANGGGTWFDPIYTEHQPLSYEIALGVESPVKINEFMASNDTGITDEAGEYEDWVELYNSSANDINLAGYFLTDDLNDPMTWQLPDVVIPAGGYLLIWCDKDLDDGPLHADLKLSSGGESIGLFSPQDEGLLPLDTYNFGAQTEDVSEGRVSDGVDEWRFFNQSTPGRANGTKLGDLNGDLRNDCLDFVELINAFGPCSAPCTQTCPADFNLDCTVDGQDLSTSLPLWDQ